MALAFSMQAEISTTVGNKKQTLKKNRNKGGMTGLKARFLQGEQVDMNRGFE